MWSVENFSLGRLRRSSGAYEGGKAAGRLGGDVRVSRGRHIAQSQTHPSQVLPQVLLCALQRLRGSRAPRRHARRSGRRWAAILARDDVSRSREQDRQRGRAQDVDANRRDRERVRVPQKWTARVEVVGGRRILRLRARKAHAHGQVQRRAARMLSVDIKGASVGARGG